MATCPKCLHQNANDPAVIFCQSCGVRLPEKSEPDRLQPSIERLERVGQAANRTANSIMSFQFWALILFLIIACLVIGVSVR